MDTKKSKPLTGSQKAPSFVDYLQHGISTHDVFGTKQVRLSKATTGGSSYIIIFVLSAVILMLINL